MNGARHIVSACPPDRNFCGLPCDLPPLLAVELTSGHLSIVE